MKTMEDLADQANLTFDGGDDNRLFMDNLMNVYAHLMTKKEYIAMEKDLSKNAIKRKLYDVYAWNDCSGYKYWKEEGENNSSNYIQVTVSIKTKNLDKIDIEKLKKDVRDLENKLCKYDNSELFVRIA